MLANFSSDFIERALKSFGEIAQTGARMSATGLNCLSATAPEMAALS